MVERWISLLGLEYIKFYYMLIIRINVISVLQLEWQRQGMT